MDMEFIRETQMLNYGSERIEKLIVSRKWRDLGEKEKIKAIYEYVQNEILFGYNRADTLTAEQVLDDGYGQCNTKATLLMALLRGCNIPCRLHGSEVKKDFQRGVTNAVISALAPDRIIHTWTEVFYQDQWLALEGVITDKRYLEAVRLLNSNTAKDIRRYAVAVDDFKNLSVDWIGNNTYVQSAAVVNDFGTFMSPDEFFIKYSQHWSKLKNFMYVYFGRKMMNANVAKIRKGILRSF